MALLCKYRTGNGFYIRGFVHGAGLCTWQIGAKGLDYLSNRGISCDRDRVSPRDLEYLRNQILIWTGGSGPGSSETPIVPLEATHLIADLQKWAISGRTHELTTVLCGRHGDQRDCCFSTEFVNWLRKLDPAVSLHHFDEISATDFEDLAVSKMSRLVGTLHHGLVSCGTSVVLWRLARLVGVVARQQWGCSSCPEVWQNEPVLKRVFALLHQLSAEPSIQESRLSGRRENHLLPPSILWEVDGQIIVAILPRQRLPSDAREMSWEISVGHVVNSKIHPRTLFEHDEFWVNESRSEAIVPSEIYTIESRIPANRAGPERLERWQIHLPEQFQPCVLFTSAGTLLDSERDSLLPSGDYLALVHGDLVEELFARNGVRRGDIIPISPVGWHRWQGWKVHLEPGANFAPYFVEPAEIGSNWELQEPPEIDVIWRSNMPVWTGQWPRIFLETQDGFSDATLEVASEDPMSLFEPKYLQIGTDVRVNHEGGGGRSFLDLATAPTIRECYGQLRLRCRPLNSVDRPPLTARFVRLPDLQLSYVSDPNGTDNALSVRVESDLPLTELTTELGSRTLVTNEGTRVAILSAVDPVLTPTVVAWLPQKKGELQIRVPVSRGAWLTSQRVLPNWQLLPIEDLDLKEIGLDDRLRIELHEAPLLDHGKILFRFSNGIELWAGEPFCRDQRTHVFEVDLHRWRDTFGIGMAGVVQFRSQTRWIDIARLGGQPLQMRPSPHRSVPRYQLLVELEQAVAKGDEKAAEDAIAACFRRALDQKASVIEAELLPIVGARTVLGMATRVKQLEDAAVALDGLTTRTDLPEVKALHRMLLLRSQSLLNSTETWCNDSVQRIQSEIAECPEKDLLQGECYYHYARSFSGRVDACWRSCMEYTEKYLDSASRGGFQTHYSDAILLLELARLMQGQVPERHSRHDSKLEHVCPFHSPWIEAIRLLGKMVRSSTFTRENFPIVTPLPDTFPKVLRQEDVVLLRIAVAQVQDGVLARQLLIQLKEWSSDQFYAIGLLRARQALADGQVGVALAEYDRLFVQINAIGPDELLDVVVAERQQCRR